MDPTRFDELSKTLSTARSRRSLLKTLGAGLVGAVAAATRALPAAADRKCKYGGANCAHDFNCCSGTCCNHVCCDAPPVNGIGTCQYGVCGFTCLSGTTACGGACVADCTGGLVLDTSTCTCVCPSGTTGCGNSCVTNCTGGQMLNTSTCTCETPFPTCSGGTCTGSSVSCGANCSCVPTVEGPSACLQDVGGVCGGGSCTSSADCNGGVCLAVPCCGISTGGICVAASFFCTA